MASGAATRARRCARFFEIDAPHIVEAALTALARCGDLSDEEAADAIRTLGIDPDRERLGPVAP